MSMIRLLALVAALVLSLGGCGSEHDSARDPADDAAGSAATPEFSYDVVALVSGSAARGPGAEGTRPALLADEAALRQFADQFQGPLPASLEDQGARALADLPDGQVLTATVVAVGCEPPTEVSVTHEGGTVHVEAVPVDSTIQCFVPVTTVALVSMPQEYAQGFRQDLGAE